MGLIPPSAPASAPRQRKYQQILDYIYAEISSGRVAPGDVLPTEAELSQRLGSSRGTIRHALDKLVQEGAIYRVQGRGTFVSTEQKRRAKSQLDVFALIAPELRAGFYPSLVHGFEQTSADISHQVIVASSGNETSRQGDLILQMIDRSVGGIALVPTTTMVTPAYQIRQLQKNQIPVVFCHRTVKGASAPCVTWSGQEVGRQAGVEFAQQGHRRVCCFFNRRTSLANEYEAGLQAALENDPKCKGDVETVEYLVRTEARESASTDREDFSRALQQLLSRPHRPTAIFCGNMPDAEQVYLHATSLGLEIPRDLSLIAFGGTWREHGLAKSISCVAVNEHEVGARAAHLLHEMRSGKRPLEDSERIELPVTLLAGQTVGRAANQLHETNNRE